MRALACASILAALFIASLAQPADAKEFKLKVVDEQGQPVPKFEAMIYSGAGLHWAAGENGTVSLTADQLPPTIRVVVRADGFASTAQQFAGNEREKLLQGESSITLPRGDEVTLQLQFPPGMSWPKDAVPQVYFASWQQVAQSARSADGRKWYEDRNGGKPVDLNMLNVRPSDAGSFVLRFAPNPSGFSVAINIPGFLQHFEAGPFIASNFKNGLLKVDVPQPGNLEVQLDLGAAPVDKLPFKMIRYQVMYQRPGQKNMTEIAGESVVPDAKPLQLNDIPSGNYWIMVFTLTSANAAPAFSEEADPRRFSDFKQLTLRAGQTEKVDFQYVPLTPDAFKGNRTAVLYFETVDGNPAAGRNVVVSYYVDHYGLLPIFSGKVPESGQVTLKDISDAKPDQSNGREPYLVRIGKDQAGGFHFKSSQEPSEEFKFRCPPQPGDMAPNVELLDVADGKSIKLNDLRGKVVLLDFWATWCGPCQPALEKLDTVAAEKADAWKDRVVILPVSIDDESEKAKTHLIGRGWTHLTPYWTGAEGKQSFEAPAMQAFVVNGVPTSFLIDPTGKILWRGHPLSTEGGQTLEDRIDAALK